MNLMGSLARVSAFNNIHIAIETYVAEWIVE